MSMFSRPLASGGSGSGLTAEQYAGLTQDAELAAAVTDIKNRTTTDVSNAVSNINGHTSWATSSVTASIQSILFSGSFLPAGTLLLANRPHGQPSPGFRRVSGIGVPADFFAVARTVVLPYTIGANGVTSNGAATGRLAVLSENAYVLATTSARKFNLGTMAWADLPSTPVIISGTVLPATTFGTVGGFVLATGFTTTSGFQSQATCLLDPATDSWSQVATQPTFLCEQGIADLGGGRCALFGGKTSPAQIAATAGGIVDTVRVYNASTGVYSALAALPARMAFVRTARRSSGGVFLFPSNTSDGTTLTTGSRRVFLWTEAGGAVELDSLPADVSVAPYLLQPLADGRLVYVPTTAPTAGARARVLNPAAAAGSQWSNFDWDMNANATYQSAPVGCENKPTPSGFAFTAQTVGTSVSGLSATFIGAPAVNWSESFYQQRIE